jgi:hypothetical protein
MRSHKLSLIRLPFDIKRQKKNTRNQHIFNISNISLANVDEIILDFRGRELSERASTLANSGIGRFKVAANDANLQAMLVHGALKALLERQDGRMDRIFQLQILRKSAVIKLSDGTHRFSRNVFALIIFLPIAVAFHAQ